VEAVERVVAVSPVVVVLPLGTVSVGRPVSSGSGRSTAMGSWGPMSERVPSGSWMSATPASISGEPCLGVYWLASHSPGTTDAHIGSA